MALSRKIDSAEIVEFWQTNYKNITKTAKRFGIARSTVRAHLARQNVGNKPLVGGSIHAPKADAMPIPSEGVRRYLLTSAQNNTRIHKPFWANLMALKEHIGAELLIGTFTYNHNAYGQLAVKRGTRKLQGSLWYDNLIEPYVVDKRVMLTPSLAWCGEMNILPTAIYPISGLESYTGRASSIFPHAKISLDSVPSGKYEGTKFCYTTGSVTQRNYINKKAGLKAEFHHSYGALLVEVNSSGSWFVRQINASDTGEFYDLDMRVQDEKISTGHHAMAINWGDVHVAKLETPVEEIAWGKNGMLDVLKPKYQFMHDLFDFRARNHHDTKDPHGMFARHVHGPNVVEQEINEVASFLHKASRPQVETVVVDSNHDNAFTRWLRDGDYKTDPANALYFLESQLEYYRAIERDDRNFHLLEWALRRAQCPKTVRFLREDESFIICPDTYGGIECGMHGHLGPNGARGNPKSFAKMGRKSNTGHTHSAQIINGVYVAGVTAALIQGYNKGPSSWSHSHILTYENGKRTIITMWQGKWRA